MANLNIAHMPIDSKSRQTEDFAMILYRLRDHIRDAEIGLCVLEKSCPIPDDDDASEAEEVGWAAHKISQDLSDCRAEIGRLEAALANGSQGPDLLGDAARAASADHKFEAAWRALYQADSDCRAASEVATADRDQVQRLADLRQSAASRLMALPARSASQLIAKLWIALADHADGRPCYFEASTLEQLTSEAARFSDLPQFTRSRA